MEENIQRGKQEKRPLRICAYLSRVSGLEGAPDKYRGKRDDVPGFRWGSCSREFSLSPEKKKYDGHETGQKTPYRQGPHRLCGIDVSPEIASLPSEKTGPLIVLVVRRGFGILAPGVHVGVPVCAM